MILIQEWITAMYIVAMFGCCSMFNLLHLDGYLLFIADRCHICFACHFQTVHPIPVIFISISTESPHLSCGTLGFPSWGQVQSSLCKSCICITYRIPHSIPCLASCCLYISRCWLWFRLFVFLSWVEPGDEYVNKEPIEYAYKDQGNSENFAGKMIIPSKSLLSLLC